jgi:hypothetical protein
MRMALAAAMLAVSAASTGAQILAQRGFVGASVVVFPQTTSNDRTRLIGDLLVREEGFLKPAPWLQFAAGVDVRANSDDQVDDRWNLDVSDRTAARPPLSVRRLVATLTRRGLTVDIGKQFIRWGKADFVTPVDRFAPRDFINVLVSEFLAVTGVRASLQARNDALEAVWVPRFTPSRLPLFTQRWIAIPVELAGVPITDGDSILPARTQAGIRWSHSGSALEYSLSFFDGLNHLPALEAASPPSSDIITLTRVYPAIRTYGADAAVPTRWFTIKGEAAYFTSSSAKADEYVLYVVQLERQTGEWILAGGYSGEAVTVRRVSFTFAPDRGLTRAFVARALYTIDTNRTIAVEGAARQDGNGAYARLEYSHARGQHWRATITAVGIAGRPNDFLGQYRRNSHVAVALRYSF